MDRGAASGDVPMETEPAGGEEVDAKVARTKSKSQAAPKVAAVCSGLPQSREELEALIQTIHRTVNDSVLPRLNKCLTAKVTHTHTQKTLPRTAVTQCLSSCRSHGTRSTSR